MALVLWYGQHIPAFEGPDEQRHFAYVSKVALEGQLPHPEDDVDTLIRQQAGQAPFYYVSTALFLKLRDFGTWEIEPQANLWWEKDRSERIDDNLNHFLMSPDVHAMSLEQQHLAEVLQWARLASVGYGLLTIAGVYWAGLALWPQRRTWALWAAMMMALTPQLIHAFAMVSNDAAVIAFSTLVLAGALHLLRDYRQWRVLIFTGVMMGLAVLSKANGLAIWPIPILAVLASWWGQRQVGEDLWQAVRRLVMPLALLGTLALLCGGWWVIRAWWLYGDAFGLQPHAQQSWFMDSPQWPSLGYALSEFAKGMRDMWINFGWGKIRPALWGYIPALVLIVGGVVGLIKQKLDRRIWLLALVLGLGAAAYLQWMRLSYSTPGRLMFPYYGAFVLLMAWGWGYWGRVGRVWMAGALGALVIVLVPLTLDVAFGYPRLFETLPDDVEEVAFVFGEAELVGYRVEDGEIRAGAKIDIRLCWRVDSVLAAVDMPYAFSVQIMDERGGIFGERASYFGMGHYTRWQSGKIFCDKVEVKLSPEMVAGKAYQIGVDVFEPLSGVSLTPYVDRVVIGNLVVE